MPKLFRFFCFSLVLLLLPLCVLAAEEDTECVHIVSAWEAADETTHTAVCTLCGDTVVKVHEYSEYWKVTATEHRKECLVCGYTTEAAAHTLPDTWEGDEVNHIRLCTVCQVGGESRDHLWDKGETLRPAGLFRDGQRRFTCSVCGFARTERLPAHRTLGIILVSVMGTAVLAAAVFFILRMTKKKRVG